MFTYSANYYERLRSGSRLSAREIVPLVLDRVAPDSVVDVGCGTGTWLSIFEEHGIEDILGIDGDSLDRELLEIPDERFLQADLTQDVAIDRTFDLAVCLEVAEHLPEESAESLVGLLTELSPVVLFSAAVPFQGGRHHVNEQWPDYWHRLFQERHYVVVDGVRKHIWTNENVEWWYAQNTLIFVKEDELSQYPVLERERQDTWESQLTLVHPANYITAHWDTRVDLIRQDLTQIVSENESIILADGDDFRVLLERNLDTSFIPFLERNGEYNGPPSDSATAIRELERLRRQGAAYFVLAWPVFWWLDYYSKLTAYLESNFQTLIDNDNLKVFDLRT